MSFIQYDWCPYKKMSYEETDMPTGRVVCEHEGRDRCEASISQGTPKVASKPLKSKQFAWNGFSQLSLKDQPC